MDRPAKLRPARLLYRLPVRIGISVFASILVTALLVTWICMRSVPESAAAPVTRALPGLLALDLTMAVGFGLLAFGLANARVRALRCLAQRARRLSEGTGNPTPPRAPSADEIGLLTHAFDQMTERLVAHRAELERQQWEIEQANQLLRQQNEELQGMNEVLAQLSITDGLTKLHNHRFFQDQLVREIKRTQRTGAPLSLLLVDIDDFKLLNDSLGHAVGDTVLQHIADLMCEVIRDSDLLARYGGDEFALIAPQTELEGAWALAEKLRSGVAEAQPPAAEGTVRVTVSVGIAMLGKDGRTLFDDADRALYHAKKSGKDCVYWSTEGGCWDQPGSRKERRRRDG